MAYETEWLGERGDCNRMWDAYCLARWTEDKHYRDYGRHSYPLHQKILAMRNAYRDRWGTMDGPYQMLWDEKGSRKEALSL